LVKNVVKLSTKSSYALRALFDMAYHAPGERSKIETISKREDIPPRFLEQIFLNLKKAGLVGSKRGRGGGYYLKMPPEEITLAHIIRAVEGETCESLCRDVPTPAADGSPTSHCVATSMWSELAGRIDEMLSEMTLADAVTRAEAMGVKRAGFGKFTYMI
jgi:Rrf2 family protein